MQFTNRRNSWLSFGHITNPRRRHLFLRIIVALTSTMGFSTRSLLALALLASASGFMHRPAKKTPLVGPQAAGKINGKGHDGSTGFRGKGGDFRPDSGGATSGGAAESANIEAFRKKLMGRITSAKCITTDGVDESEKVDKNLGQALGEMREKRRVDDTTEPDSSDEAP